MKKSENSHKFSGFSLLFVEFTENFVHYKKKKEMLMNDFRLKNFNYMVLKRGDEKHFSFLFRKALRTVVYI